MPPGKSKEDTWKARDLEKATKEATDDRRRHKEKDRDREKDRERHRDKDKPRDKDREKDRDKDRDRKKDKHRDDDDRRERRHRDKENDDKSKEKSRSKPRDEDRDRPKKDERRKKDDVERRSDRDKHRERRPKDKDDGDRRRTRDDKDKHRGEDDKERRHRKDKDRDDQHRDDKDRKPRDRDERRDRKDKDEDEEERRKRHEERKERKRREQEEKEREERERKKREQAQKAQEQEDNYDDEEFEDYEDDDFEDDDDDDDKDDDDDEDTRSSTSDRKPSDTNKGRYNEDVDDILQAMNQENERLLRQSKQKQWSDDEDEQPISKSNQKSNKNTFINFVSAKQRQMSTKAMSKAARRGHELLQMLELDVVHYEMFDMPPITEYNMYMRSFGSSSTQQAYCQTNDDNIDRDLQTEDIEYKEKWTQQPPNEILSCGGPEGEKTEIDSSSPGPMDSVRLSAFVEKAGQVMIVLLEEEFLDRHAHDQARSKQSNIIISDAFTELTMPKFLRERAVVFSQFSPVQTHMLVTVHATPDQSSSDMLTRQGCVCVWNVNEPSRPQKILMCESRPTCCCFGPTKTSLVFSGMSDGSVVVWDLREQSHMHRTHKQGKHEWLLRYPTYNTAGVLHYENHQSSVRAIHPIVAPGESASASLSGLAQAETGEGLSFQLATLEENGILHLWVVAELLRPDPAGSESDYGLAPGAKVKLVKSSAIVLDNPLRDTRLRTTMKCVDMQLLPSNNSHYYAATDTGCVVHGVRYGGKSPPKAYRPRIENLVQVTSIDFSPFSEPVFLAGCEDGSLRVYHADNEMPVLSWPSTTEGAPICLVRWCRSRPAVFFVLDNRSKLYIWDLLMDDSGPLKQEAISQAHVTSLALSNDHSATGLGIAGRRPQMVVCLENGTCEIHTMSQQFSALMGDELDQFANYLQRCC